MKLSERLQGLKEEISNEITLSPELENSMDRCIEAARHLEGKMEVREKIEESTTVHIGTNNIIDDGIGESLFDDRQA